jgi:hypothetical protein
VAWVTRGGEKVAKNSGFGLEERLKGLDEFGGEALRFFVGGGADMGGGGLKQEGLAFIKDAVGEVEADALGDGGPDVDGEEIIVAGRGFVKEAGLDDGKGEVMRLVKLLEGDAEVAEKFAASGFEEVEVTRIIDVVADGAFGIRDAVGVGERIHVFDFRFAIFRESNGSLSIENAK